MDWESFFNGLGEFFQRTGRFFSMDWESFFNGLPSMFTGDSRPAALAFTHTSFGAPGLRAETSTLVMKSAGLAPDGRAATIRW